MADTIGGSIVWNLDVNSAKFDSGINAAKAKLNELNNSFDNSERKVVSASDIMAKAVSGIGTGLKEIGVLGLGAATGFVAFATTAAFSASRVDELTLALHAIGKANGISATQTDLAVTALRKNNIAYADALKVTSNFITANLKLTDAIKLSNAAKDLAIVAGVGSSEATNMLTQAIVTGQTQQLAQFGILTTQTRAYGDYAKSIGVSADALTEQQKQQALLNVVLDQGTKVAGVYDAAQQSAGKQFRSLASRILPDFIAKLGQAFEPSLLVAVQAMTKGIQDMGNWIDVNKTVIADWGKKMADVAKIAFDLFGKAFNWLLANKEIVIGAITAMGVGIVALGVGFAIAHAPALILFAAITGLVTLFQKSPAVFIIVASALIGLGIGIATVLVPAFWALNGAAITVAGSLLLAALPFVLIALGVGLVIAALYLLITNWTAVSAFLVGVWAGIQAAFITGWNAVVSFFTVSIPSFIASFISWFVALPAQIGSFVWNVVILGAVQFLGLLVGLFVYGIPALITTIVTFLMALPGNIANILGFVFNQFVQGWLAIWGWLTAVVPQIIASVVTFIAQLPAKVIAFMIQTRNSFVTGFQDIWTSIVGILTTWPGKLFDWGVNLMRSFADGIKSAIGAIADAFRAGMDNAKKLVQGHSPPIAGPFKDIDKWGFNVGKAWSDGIASGVKSLTLPSMNDGAFSMAGSLAGQYAPAPAQAMAPASNGGKGGIEKLVNIERMEVRQDSDITDVARDLAFRIETSTGFTQNG